MSQQQPPLLSTISNHHNHNNNNNNREVESIKIVLSRPLRSASGYNLIYFEWSLFITLAILFFSII